MDEIYNNLALELNNKIKINKQYWLGITGGPGAGKSTLSNKLKSIMSQKYNIKTLIIPMDGYHYTKKNLIEKDNYNFFFLKRRGSPMTFDVNNFINNLLVAKNSEESIYFPSFCRIFDDPINNDIEYNSSYQLIIVEGNYLKIGHLLEDEIDFDSYLESKKWIKLNNFFNETWYIDVNGGDEIQRERLIKRHLETWNHEKNLLWQVNNKLDGATKQTDFNDMPNLNLVSKTKKYCDKIIVSF